MHVPHLSCCHLAPCSCKCRRAAASSSTSLNSLLLSWLHFCKHFNRSLLLQPLLSRLLLL
jgi:hypothetical protein